MVSDRKLAVIIEDDPDVRNLLRTVLTQSGFETILTSNGEDGVAAVRMHDPVLTTLDVSMPGMDGVAAAGAIRDFSDTYIIMITAQDDEIDIISGLNAGADEYLSKPFRPRELRARIASLMRRPRGGVGEADAAAPVDDGLWRRPSEPPAGRSVERPSSLGQAAPAPQIEAVLPTAAPLAYAPAAAAAERYRSTEHASTRQDTPFDSQAPAVSPAAGQSMATADGVYEHNGLALSVATGQVVAAGRRVEVEPDEFDLLRTLMSTGRRVRSKADLVLAARGESYVTSYFVTEHDKRQIDRQIASLRRKLHDEVDPGRWIETVAGVGYRMAT